MNTRSRYQIQVFCPRAYQDWAAEPTVEEDEKPVAVESFARTVLYCGLGAVCMLTVFVTAA